MVRTSYEELRGKSFLDTYFRFCDQDCLAARRIEIRILDIREREGAERRAVHK